MSANASGPSAPGSARRKFLSAVIGGGLGAGAILGWKWWNSPPAAGNWSFLGKQPPEFPAGGAWINAETPLALAGLRGKVVLLQFSFIGCGACRLMNPHLADFHAKFGPDGLVIVEIDDGAIDTLEETREWAAKEKVPYPVYYDAGGAMTRAFGVSSFPTTCLVGRNGTVAWEGGGWGGAEGVATYEAVIAKTLAAK